MIARKFAFALTVLAVLSFAPALRAQVTNNCEFFYCTAYGYYSFGGISGYVEYYDATDDWYLGLSVNVDDPSSGETYIDSEWDYDDVSVDVTGFTVDANGAWNIVGYPWADGYGDAGSIYYEIDVINQPTGEETGYFGSPYSVGVIFNATLQPTTFNFDAYQTAETLGSTSDSCWDMYRAASGPASATAMPPFNTVGNNYQDTISAPFDYVEANQAAVNYFGYGCGWSVFQSMSYNGGSPYASRYLLYTFSTGREIDVCRGDTCYWVYH